MDASNSNQQQNTPEVTKLPATKETIVINETIIRPIDRQVKDIEYWRSGHIAAERVVYPNRVRLYDLYHDVILDGHLSGIWKKRVSAVLNKTLHYYDANGVKVDKMDKLIQSKPFRKMIKELMQEKAWGITGLEFIPGSKFAFKRINRKHIKPETGIVAIEQYGTEGYAYDGLPLVWVVGEPDEYGFLLECAPYALYKRGTMADWSQFSEIFGMPMRVAKYDSNDIKTKIELKQVLDGSGSALVMMIPKQADFEIIDGKITNADGAIYSNLKNACDDEMSVVVLGVTETTSSSKSSGFAQSKVHAAQQLEITKDDILDMQMTLNEEKFHSILESYALPVVAGGEFKYEEEVNLDHLAKRVQIDGQVAKRVPVGDDYWYKTYGIEKPKNYAELKKKMEKANNPDPAADPASSEPEEDDDQDDPAASASQKPKLSKIDKLRLALSNFFGPAHTD